MNVFEAMDIMADPQPHIAPLILDDIYPFHEDGTLNAEVVVVMTLMGRGVALEDAVDSYLIAVQGGTA